MSKHPSQGVLSNMVDKEIETIPTAAREELARRIVGEVVLSQQSGTTLRKWREIFSITTSNLAEKIGVSPSVVSDYEASRRSPGTMLMKTRGWIRTSSRNTRRREFPSMSKNRPEPTWTFGFYPRSAWTAAIAPPG